MNKYITLDNHKSLDPLYFESHWYSGITDFLKTCWVRVFGASKGPSSFDHSMFSREIQISPKIDAKLQDLFVYTSPGNIKKNLEKDSVQLESSSLNTALMYFQTIHPDRFIYTDKFFNPDFRSIKKSCLDSIVEDLAKDQTDQTDYVIVPLVVEKRYLFGKIKIQHISQIAIDLRNRHVIYYDPKTKDPRDVTLANNLPLMTVIEKLSDRFIPREEGQKLHIRYNTEKHQYDCHNCGIFVLIFLNRLLQANGLQELRQGQFFDYSQTVQQDRQVILENLTSFIKPDIPKDESSTVSKDDDLLSELPE